MKMRSTGLGTTELLGDIEGVSSVSDFLVLSVRTTDPVRWHVRTGIDGRDLRALIKYMFSFTVMKFVLFNIFKKRKDVYDPPPDF
ncbi:hypothetical protein ACFL9T_16440 [Thermodesulfobacteriota bacterium]